MRGDARSRRVQSLDLAVAGLGVLAFGYFIGGNVWFGSDLPLAAELYGLRDTAFVSLLYFVGRASPEVVEDPRLLRALFLVGVATSAIAVLERLFVTPDALVLLGAARYVQDFLGATAVTAGNVYGLPDNYWTDIGGQLVQRAGSTYLSAQGLAIPYLVILPAATLWALAGSGGRAALRWLGYALLWTGLLLSVTRMTTAICALTTVLVLLARRRWSALVGLGLVALAGLGVALVLAPRLMTFAWETLTWETDSSLTHLGDWTEGLLNFVRHPLGVGLGSTDFVAARFGLAPLTADNQYFRYAVELGGLGLLLHLAVLAGALASGARVAFALRREPAAAYGVLLVAVVLGVALNAFTAVVFNSLVLAYVFFWLAGAVTTTAGRGRSVPA
jgi:hypothetical protein